MSITAPSARRGVLAFLAIAFGLTWVPFLPVLFGGPGLSLLMPFAPAIACVVVRRWVTKEGFGDVGLRPDLRTAWPWLLLAAVWPFVATPLAVAVAAVTGATGASFAGLGEVGALTLAAWVAGSLLATPVFLGEELGWRGYLQLRLFPGRPLAAAAATGVVWGVWHYPLWLAMPDMPLWMLPLMTVTLAVASVFFGALQARSGTVWVACLGHSTNNTFEANFGSVVFTGRAGANSLPLAPSLVIVLAEACVLLGAVAVAARRWPGVRSPRLAATS